MERRYQIPRSLYIVGEIKRIIGRVREDDASGFDFFENDIFVLFDPNQPIECGCGDNEDSDSMDGDENDHPTIKGNTEILDELRQDAIEDEIGDFEPDEDDFIRSVAIEITGNMFSPMGDPSPNSTKMTSAPIAFPIGEHDPNCIMSQPNFHYKPSDLKVWWMENGITTNQPVTFRMIHNIMNHCIISLGRRTDEFMARGLIFDGDYLDLDRMPLEENEDEEDEADADMRES